jgi:hypothetical protein
MRLLSMPEVPGASVSFGGVKFFTVSVTGGGY